MTLTPEQLAGLIAAAEAYARAHQDWWENSTSENRLDDALDEARDELHTFITDIEADDYGVKRAPVFGITQPPGGYRETGRGIDREE